MRADAAALTQTGIIFGETAIDSDLIGCLVHRFILLYSDAVIIQEGTDRAGIYAEGNHATTAVRRILADADVLTRNLAVCAKNTRERVNSPGCWCGEHKRTVPFCFPLREIMEDVY